MRSGFCVAVLLGVSVALGTSVASAQSLLSADQIIQKVLDSDPWGLGGAEVTAKATLTDKRKSTSELGFSAHSLRYAPPLSKSLVRFTAPADLVGAGFLQVQKADGDDDRYLYLPDLKRSRRISGNLRSTSFMGTDFSFADLDRRDLRESSGVSKPDENVGKFACYRVDVTPRRADSEYSKIELWVRKDNFIPLKMLMYDKANVLLKTLTVVELRRVSGAWFITRSRMENHREGHSTQLVLDKITARADFPADEFTVRTLEKN